MRDRVLDAAEQVLVTKGVDALTLDAVAAKAEVSKGGLLHHFSSKRALISGVVTRLCDQFDAHLPPPGAPKGAFTSAYLAATIPAEPGPPGHEEQVAVALLAAISGGPQVIEELRVRYRRWQERLADDGLPEREATLVRLAVDGWWLSRLLDLSPPSGQVHREVRQKLVKIIGGTP